MARIGFARGPAAPLNITNVTQIIPGVTFNRFWDSGPILLLAEVRVDNGTPAQRTYTLTLARNAVGLGLATPTHTVPASGQALLHRLWLNEFPSELATFDLRIQGDDPASGGIAPNDAILVVLQLPPFDLGDLIPGP